MLVECQRNPVICRFLTNNFNLPMSCKWFPWHFIYYIHPHSICKTSIYIVVSIGNMSNPMSLLSEITELFCRQLLLKDRQHFMNCVYKDMCTL